MSRAERMDAVAAAWETNRNDLIRFARRLVLRQEVAEELVQHAAERAIRAGDAPAESTELRKWLFRITSNLAIDELRRQGRWPATIVADSRREAESDETFIAASQSMVGSPEVAAIANQHLAFCFACTLRSLAPHRAAALLLVEVYAFSLKETAAILTASTAQAKNWLQEARAFLDTRYAETCALINKRGVCFQCSELSGYFNGRPKNPLEGTGGTTDDRLRIVKACDNDVSAWHERLMGIIERRRPPEGG